MYANIIAAAALLAAAPLVNAAGKAIVQNECSFPVYLWSVAASSGPMVSVPAGTNYSEAYRINTNGGGVSIKIAAEKDQNAGVTQFEYTFTDPTIWYDISNINGYPFEAWGVTLTPTDSNCPIKDCEAGVELCTNAYNVYNDDAATAACGDAADLVLVLCSGDGVSSTTSTSSVAASSTSTKTAASSTQVAASTTKTTVVAASTTTTVSTVRLTSTTVKTSGTTFLTSTTSTSQSSSKSTSTSTSAVVTSAAVSTSSNANEVVITTYVTSWTTIDGDEPTSTSAAAAAAASTSTGFNWHGHQGHNGKRSEERRHVHRHARDIVA